MPLTLLNREALADFVIGQGAWVSLHTGNPGNAGANEATGGAPAYTRKETTWLGDVTDDGVRTGAQVVFDVPAGTYTYFGLWTSAVGGTLIGYGVITSMSTAAQRQLKLVPTVTVA